MDTPQQYSAAETERMMKLQDVLLKAMAKKITWWAAAEIIGVTDRTMAMRGWPAAGRGNRVRISDPTGVVTAAAMESTGTYWRPVWAVPEEHLDLTLCNAAHIQQVPGRKANQKDAEWIADLLEARLMMR